MSIEYTMNFRHDYKKAILDYFEKSGVDLTPYNTDDIFKLSLEFHKYQKVLLEESNIDEDTSMDAKYSSDMMFKWLSHLEEHIDDSIEEIVQLAQDNNITINQYPLHIELQLNIEDRSYEIYETKNKFQINLEN